VKALLSVAPGGPDSLVIGERSDPVTGDGQLLVDVHAVGVNFPDVLIIQDQYQFRPPRPFAPGAEFSGVVRALGRDVEGFATGDRVVGTTVCGAMAEVIAADARRCVRMPPDMPFDEGAALLFTYGTAHYALRRRAQLQPREKLLVLGAAGGVGTAAVEIGKAMGAFVLAAASSQEKVDFARGAGADGGLVYPAGELDRAAQKEFSDAIRAAASGGINVVLDAVGGDYTEPALRALEWEGRLLVVGFPAGIPRIPLNLPLLKGCQIVGVFLGSHIERDPAGHAIDLAELFELYRQRKVRPRISARYPLERGGEAIQELVGRRALGKIVVEIRSD
jgi:NADPH2:quinone reductase